jgi:hypothetical protein
VKTLLLEGAVIMQILDHQLVQEEKKKEMYHPRKV